MGDTIRYPNMGTVKKAAEIYGLSPAYIRRLCKGLMIESYIEDGAQGVHDGVYGKSITDPCLGWEKTERLLLDLAEEL